MTNLVIFDIDGTLVESWTDELLPGVERYFDTIALLPPDSRPKIALATNQGGVSLRYWMERDQFGEPEKYPTQADAEGRCNAIVASIMGAAPCPLYISFAYQTKAGKWAPTPYDNSPKEGEFGHPVHIPGEWLQYWRKPNPGMLLQAIDDTPGCDPSTTLMVGDSEEDQLAAKEAGCEFRWADEFFYRKEK